MPQVDVDCYDTRYCGGDCDECDIFKELADGDEADLEGNAGRKLDA